MRAIYLVGFMGSGKTTVGRALGEALGVAVYDTDELIEKRQNRSIRDIFSTDGELVFRTIESEILQELPTENAVITTGGGIVLAEKNRIWMQQNGLVFHLYCEPETLLLRLASDTKRPLLDGNKQANIFRLFNERLHLYKSSGILIDTTKKNVDEIVTEIRDMAKKQTEGQ